MTMTTCIVCDHPVSGTTPAAMVDAMREHGDFVNATKDRDRDPHFEDARLTALLEA